MLGIHDFGLFVGAGILLNIVPGQDTVYILGRTAAGGRRTGIASALGVSAGGLIHTMAAAFGLSAILASSATAFLIVKLLGAAYLVYLGIQLLMRSHRHLPSSPSYESNSGVAKAFWTGMLTNVSNPKVALFFLAFLPQFIEPTSSSQVLPFLMLGITFVATGTLWCLFLTMCADYMRSRAESATWLSTVLPRLCGAVFIAMGLRLVVSK